MAGGFRVVWGGRGGSGEVQWSYGWEGATGSKLVNMVLNVTETIRLIRDGDKWEEEVWMWGPGGGGAGR